MSVISQSSLLAFFNELLPPAPTHLPLIYHHPRAGRRITRLILAITPTQGLYTALAPNTAIFLHRPWGLDRSRLLPSTLVLASHQRLDELLTTGWNQALLDRLRVQEPRGGILGYKLDPERKMGLIGQVDGTFEELLQIITLEFDGLEGHAIGAMEEPRTIKALACMNAFDSTIVNRVIETAQVDFGVRPDEFLYVTGESRKDGLEVATLLGMPVVFVGHRRAELWAIRYLEQRCKKHWPELTTLVLNEPEEPRLDRPKAKAVPQLLVESSIS